MANFEAINWQRGRLLGCGTFGSVYVATNGDNGAIYAVREIELSPDEPNSAERLRQLGQEVNVLSQLKHPNIVQYYGSEMVAHRLYIFMEYVHPGSINTFVREPSGAIPEFDVRHTFVQEPSGAITEFDVQRYTHHILSGLAYLHSNSIIHRDIKGANLLIDSAGVVKLADFGIAKHLIGPVNDLPMKRRAYWMAPELLEASLKEEDISNLFAVDIWSLGCTIIEMFTGKPPWSKYESAAAMFKILRATPPIPETLSLEGKDFLRRCFERNPAERPQAAMLLEHPFVKNVTDIVSV